jgi:hypothetical protein
MPTFVPEITKAYQDDPRTKLAQALVQTGANTGPVAGGGWAWADGIARALSGLAGGYVQHKQEQKFEKLDQAANSDAKKAMNDAIAQALAGNGAASAPAGPPQAAAVPQGGPVPAQQPAQAPVQAPPPQPDPLAPLPDGSQAPQGAPQGMPPASIAQAPQAAPAAPQGPSPAAQAMPAAAPAAAAQIAAALGGGSAANPATPFGQPKPRVSGASVVQAMLPITRATESNNKDFTASGTPVTSVKGAKYAMQVMPATARKPGFGIRPAANDSPEEYNRVGTELLGKLVEKYGDPAKGWAAYNAGTGRVNHAIAKHGDDWLQHLPAETQAYVKKNVEALGNTDPSQAGYYPETQQAELKPTGPIQYQTPEPETPSLPDRPADRGSARSLRLLAGRNLLNANPALFTRAMEMLDTGMGEQFAADRDALAENNNRDDTLYKAGIDDHFNATSQKRAAAYDTRGREQTEGYAYGREMRGYAHDDNNREDTQSFTAGESAKDRAATAANIQAQIEGRHEDAQTKAAARMQNFLNTPAGTRMYQQTTDTMKQNDDIVNQINSFMELNEAHPNATGGFIMNSAPEWIARNMSQSTQAMDAITNKIAPLMRQAGQGSMSDSDLKKFERSVPNVRNLIGANRQTAARLKAGMARINDFELHKLQAAAEGRQVQFLQEWNMYKSQVPFEKGISFDDWKSSVPQYGADGKRK